MARRTKQVFGTIVCAAACMQAYGSPVAADATVQHSLKIERQPLARALQEFAEQSGVQIIFFAGVAEGREAPPLAGRFTTEAALERLLDPSRLTFREIHPNTIEICELAARTTHNAGPQHGPLPEQASMQKEITGTQRSMYRSTLRRAGRWSGALMSTAAATAGAQSNLPSLEEIVVTAQKRVERLQDVPLSVTAVSGDYLADRQINDTNGLAQAVPSLTYQQGMNPTTTSFRIRGIGTSLFGQGVEASVSVVVDGVVAARQAQNFADFADIERVEILRGPQGTLFGKNATAGVLNVVTARPSREFEGKAEVTVAEQNEYRIRSTLSGPLSEATGARLTAYYNDVGGHLYNVALGRDDGGSEGYGVRGKFEWDAIENLNLLFSGDYRRSEADCCRTLLIHTENPAMTQLYQPVRISPRNRQTLDNGPTWSENDQKTFSVQGDLTLGAATLTSISAFQNFKIRHNLDVDSIDTPVPIFVGTGAGALAQFDLNGGEVDLDQITQELRIASDDSARLTYVAGLYYSNLALDRSWQRRSASCATGTLGAPCASPTFVSASHVAKLKTDSFALFGQGEYAIVDGLTAIVGLRGQYEKVEVAGTRTGIPLVPGDGLFPGHGANTGKRSADDSVVTGKAGLQYKFNRDAQAYGTYTRGYKGLGFDTEITANFAGQNPVRPETVDAYEIGFKGQSADGLFSVAAALFLADYKDLQVQANRSDAVTGVISYVQTNAGTSQTKGFELEATLRPLAGLRVQAGATYTDTTVNVDGLNCSLQDQAAAPILSGNFPVNSCYRKVLPSGAASGPIQDVRGGTLPAAPQWRVNLSPRYERELGASGIIGFLQLNATYNTKQQFAVEQNPLLVQDAYTLVDASFGVGDADDRYNVTLFVKNLFDENYFTMVTNGSLLARPTSPFDLYANVPKDANRYFGATVRVSF